MKMTSAINPAIMKNMEYSLSAMFNNQEEKVCAILLYCQLFQRLCVTYQTKNSTRSTSDTFATVLSASLASQL